MYVYSLSIVNSTGKRYFLAIIMFFSYQKNIARIAPFSFEITYTFRWTWFWVLPVIQTPEHIIPDPETIRFSITRFLVWGFIHSFSRGDEPILSRSSYFIKGRELTLFLSNWNLIHIIFSMYFLFIKLTKNNTLKKLANPYKYYILACKSQVLTLNAIILYMKGYFLNLGETQQSHEEKT